MKPQITFMATGGPYDQQPLQIPPPIRWVRKALVMKGVKGDKRWHNYLFSRIDYSAKYLGVVVANQQAGVD